MILRRRLLVSFGAALALAACAAEAPDLTSDVGSINVRAVSVDVSSLAQAVEGREISVSKAQLQRDLTAALTKSLAQASDPNGTPVQVAVQVSKVQLTSPLRAAVAAGPSFVEGFVSVMALGGDAVVMAPTALKGSSEAVRLPGTIGIVTSPSAEKDYRQTLDGFAETVKKALTGDQT